MEPTQPSRPCPYTAGHEAWALYVVSYLASSESAQVADELLQALNSAGRAYELPDHAFELRGRLADDAAASDSPF